MIDIAIVLFNFLPDSKQNYIYPQKTKSKSRFFKGKSNRTWKIRILTALNICNVTNRWQIPDFRSDGNNYVCIFQPLSKARWPTKMATLFTILLSILVSNLNVANNNVNYDVPVMYCDALDYAASDFRDFALLRSNCRTSLYRRPCAMLTCGRYGCVEPAHTRTDRDSAAPIRLCCSLFYCWPAVIFTRTQGEQVYPSEASTSDRWSIRLRLFMILSPTISSVFSPYRRRGYLIVHRRVLNST